MNELYEFSCGCKVPILEDKVKSEDGLPPISLNLEDLCIDLNYGKSCPMVWEFLQTGKTKGVFQLESKLGADWCAALQPTSLKDISALISIIRPGTLQNVVKTAKNPDGINMTALFIERKHGREEIEYLTPEIEPFVKDTQGIITYQEQQMSIARELAGFDGIMVNKLRKATGKKNAEELFALEEDFVKGCEKVGKVSKEDAKQIFEWIKKSARYSFNESHGISYGMETYITAWLKCHFPLHFYCSWLYFSRFKNKDEDKEISELILDARDRGIDVCCPSIKTMKLNNSGTCIKDGRLYYGIRDVKTIGQASLQAFANVVDKAEDFLGKNIEDFTWLELLVFILSSGIDKDVVNAIISAGVFDTYNIPRKKMLFEYNQIKILSDRELNTTKGLNANNLTELLELLLEIPRKDGGPANKSRKNKIDACIKQLKETPHDLTDDPKFIYRQEKEYMGESVSYAAVETVSSDYQGDTTCKEFLDGKSEYSMSIVGHIDNVREYKIKKGDAKGKKMCFVTVSDKTGVLDAVIFADEYDEFIDLIFPGNIVNIIGYRSKKNRFSIKKVIEL
ncbi:MAG: OB-fold nucleic acid binding domain-containing protein [Candidatus Thorarchaeota archaeon]